MRKIAIPLILILLVVGATVSCASSDIRLGAYLSKQSAEIYYTAIDKAYLRGDVSEADHDKAAGYYDTWYDAQVVLHGAIALGDDEKANEKLVIVLEMVGALKDLAEKLGVL